MCGEWGMRGLQPSLELIVDGTVSKAILQMGNISVHLAAGAGKYKKSLAWGKRLLFLLGKQVELD